MSQSLQQAVQTSPMTTEQERLFARSVPVFINVRDRLEPLVKLLHWLNKAGHSNITLINVASSYPPLLEFLRACPYRVVNLKNNLGQSALWRVSAFREVIDTEWFVYTDSDVVPADKCPLDAVAYFYHLLQRFPNYVKAGFGLSLHDIPDRYHHKRKVVQWESGLYGRELLPGVFQADIDTTFALHRPHVTYTLGPAMRTRGLYEAHHYPWYVDSANPDKEEIYYQAHARLARRHWKLNGETHGNPAVPPVPGGIAAQIESDPRPVLASILGSESGKAVLAYQLARGLVSSQGRVWRVSDCATAAEMEQLILEILTSDEWAAVTKILAPLRELHFAIVSWIAGRMRLFASHTS